MRWANLNFGPSSKELRQFSVLLIAFGLLVLGWNYLVHGALFVRMACVTACALGLMGFFRPNWIRWLFVGWMVAAFPIGWTVSKVILGLVFLVVFLPVGLVFRLIGRDALNLKRPGPGSLWHPYDSKKPASRYLRQF